MSAREGPAPLQCGEGDFELLAFTGLDRRMRGTRRPVLVMYSS